MGFLLDRTSGVTCTTQVNHQALAQLVAGRLHPGDRLPSVRELAQALSVSRSTAERIHTALCDATLAEVRPRSGTFVAPREAAEGSACAQQTYDLLKEAVARARRLGIDHARLVQLIRDLYEGPTAPSHPAPVVFPLIATRDWYESVNASLSPAFPGRLLHIPANVERPRLPPGTRFVLAGFYRHERARRLAERYGCRLLHVRYNARLLDEAMSATATEHRHLVTRDCDNAASTRAFLGHAYPEIDRARYTVWSLPEWRLAPPTLEPGHTVHATPTALPYLVDRVPAQRLKPLHPLLSEDFVDELRYLALVS